MKKTVNALASLTVLAAMAACTRTEPEVAPVVVDPVHQDFVRQAVPAVERSLTQINTAMPANGSSCADFAAEAFRARALLKMSDAYEVLQNEQVKPYTGTGRLVPWTNTERAEMSVTLKNASAECFKPMLQLETVELANAQDRNQVEPTRSLVFGAADAFSNALEYHGKDGHKLSKPGCQLINGYVREVDLVLRDAAQSPRFGEFKDSAQRLKQAVSLTCK